MLKIRGTAGLVLLTLIIAVVATACGQDDPTATPVPTATSTPVPGATATPTPEPPTAEELFQVEWEQLQADARAEGELVIILSAPASRSSRDIFDSFGTQFGITVLQAGGSGTSNVNRVLAERANGVFDVDVSVVGASSTDRLRLADALVPIEPLIIHPEASFEIDTTAGNWGDHSCHFGAPGGRWQRSKQWITIPDPAYARKKGPGTD